MLMKTIYEKKCPLCSKTFSTPTKNRLYCDNCKGKKKKKGKTTKVTKSAVKTKGAINKNFEENKVDCLIIQNGTEEECQEAKDRLIRRNRLLIKKTAYKYIKSTNSVISIEDIEQSASAGLLRAAEDYDGAKAEFSTYSMLWMEQFIRRDLCDERNLIRIPVHAYATYISAKKRYDKWIAENQTEKRFADYLYDDDTVDGEQLSDHDIENIVNVYNLLHFESLDRPVGEDDDHDTVLGDFIQNDKIDVENSVLRSDKNIKILEIAKNVLTPREMWVMTRRFGLDGGRDWTLDECGKAIPNGPVTRERVRQIEVKAKRKLKRAFERKGITGDP